MKLAPYIYNEADEDSARLFLENEYEANRIVASSLLGGCVLLIIVWILNLLHIFTTNIATVNTMLVVGLIGFLLPYIIFKVYAGKKTWIKYLLLISYVVVLATIDCLMSFNVVLIMVVPTVISCRYFSDNFTVFISGLTAVCFFVGSIINSLLDISSFDINNYTIKSQTILSVSESTTLKEAIKASENYSIIQRLREYILTGYLPKLMVFIIISVICIRIAQKGRNMVLKQASVSKEAARIESELSLASSIQANMLPIDFPAFPDIHEIDIFASMDPAKEVGGDFYDFFMIDENNLAIVTADVSGKGVPGALFMMIGKTLINDRTKRDMELSDIFAEVNNILCENNKEELFITAFEGVLNLVTGEFRYVNAGHEMPIISKGGKNFEIQKIKAGFVLGGVEDISYKSGSMQLEPGDIIFQYSDGAPEAVNTDFEQFGMDRLVNSLNKNITSTPEEIIKGVTNDIEAFVGEAEQHDDITMLCLKYNDRKTSK